MSIQTLEPRLADVGGIPIARLLPNKGKKPIGAWCFLDHAVLLILTKMTQVCRLVAIRIPICKPLAGC